MADPHVRLDRSLLGRIELEESEATGARANLQQLIDALAELRDKNAVGPDAVVLDISGQVAQFTVKLAKPEP